MPEKKPEENVPEVATPYHVLMLVLLWVFILLWIAPLATFASVSVDKAPGGDGMSAMAATDGAHRM